MIQNILLWVLKYPPSSVLEIRSQSAIHILPNTHPQRHLHFFFRIPGQFGRRPTAAIGNLMFLSPQKSLSRLRPAVRVPAVLHRTRNPWLLFIPFYGLFTILFDAGTVTITVAQLTGCPRVEEFTFHRFSIPGNGFSIVLFDAFSVIITVP